MQCVEIFAPHALRILLFDGIGTSRRCDRWGRCDFRFRAWRIRRRRHATDRHERHRCGADEMATIVPLHARPTFPGKAPGAIPRAKVGPTRSSSLVTRDQPMSIRHLYISAGSSWPIANRGTFKGSIAPGQHRPVALVKPRSNPARVVARRIAPVTR